MPHLHNPQGAIIPPVESSPPSLKLVVGLGNPGPRYAQTRHNAGRWWTAAVAETSGAQFARKLRWRGDIAECESIRLFHPDAFMNESGAPVAVAAKRANAAPAQILVAHDEVDLPPGAVKLKFGGGEAGHNGLRDISARLGDRQYWRLRIGVGKPAGGKSDVPDHVLQKPPPEEREKIQNAVRRALDIWPQLAAADFARAALLLHTPTPPANPPAKKSPAQNPADANGDL